MKINQSLVKKILKYQLIILVGIFLILDSYVFYRLYNLWQGVEIIDKQTISQTEKTGQLNINNSSTDKKIIYPVAVVIDNHAEARPNYGLSQADIVYEVPVEGGVTRFIAIYQTANSAAEKIGPVRSVRPYLVEIAKEYNALLAHAGGSPQALKLIEKFKLPNLEEIAWWGPEYFWRVHSRQAPHNLFTSLEKILKAIKDWGLNEEKINYREWLRQRQLAAPTTTPQEVKISFSNNPAYIVSYIYQAKANKYLRFQGGERHIDALNNEQIATDNLIIQFIPAKKIIDKTGRLELNLNGQGEAQIFVNGQMIQAKWAKNKLNGRTIFYSQLNNKEIKFKPGNIWIEIVPKDIKTELTGASP